MADGRRADARSVAGDSRLGDGTRVLRAGLPESRQGEPLLPGPQFASLFHLRGDPDGAEFVYARDASPTWSLYEAALGALEGGEAVLFASGMAAASAVLLATLGPGDRLLLPSDGYPHVREVALEHLGSRGVEVRSVPSGGGFAAAAEAFTAAPGGAALIWVESPSNPGLQVSDVAEICRRAHAVGALVAVDNTLATPLGQLPLELGADFSVSSDSKYMTGHSDLILGHVAVREPERAERLRRWRAATGAIAGPFETWLAHRSLGTLELRLDRQCATALELAGRLHARDDVEAVRYPGLPADPAHRLAASQMSRFGAIVCFDLGSRERAERFLAACELVTEATSFGGLHSTAERRARWPGNDVPEGFIRMSVGCETPEDLIADVERALEASGG